MGMRKTEFVMLLVMNFIVLLRFSESVVPRQEEEAVARILTTMGATSWRFNGETCNFETISEVPSPSKQANASIECDCNIGNDNNCHVIRIKHRFYSLSGFLSPDLVRLPYLQSIDFAYNLLNGMIPPEWGATRLQEISILGNRISGEIPPELGNITTLTKLHLEANQLSGTVPSDLGRLFNLQSLVLSSNRLTGMLPEALGELRNLTDFRINNNNFSGPIPNFIQNWRQLGRLEMVASGLDGPIPSNISLLQHLLDLRISDITGPSQGFPALNNAKGLIRLVLRNCNISGEIPAYIWQMRDMEMLDASFNRLVGGLYSGITGRSLRYVFLTGNMLTGDIPESLLIGANIDLSYNNFTWQGPNQPTCRPNTNMYFNLFRSSWTGNILQDVLPCTEHFTCPKYGCSLHVNSGGDDLNVRESNRVVLYEGDATVDGGAAKLYRNSVSSWGLSSTGDFMDDNTYQNTRYVARLENSTNLSSLYTTARISPISLTYFSYCLENGEYAVKLHFAEIQFTNDNTYRSLGRRVFDIYVQGQCVKKNFNIEDEANEIARPLIVPFNASVINNFLEVRFYWAGRGTTRFPVSGVYGPLISAISVDPYFKACSTGGKKKNIAAYVGSAIASLCLVFLIMGILWWKGCLKCSQRNDKDFDGLELKMIYFSLKQLRTATSNFSATNKIGEGGFGPVYKGTLPDGTVIAVKQLSSQSKQGNREFLNEIVMISCLQHPNLVKLHGCSIEGDQLLLVYEYLENNCLSNALFEVDNFADVAIKPSSLLCSNDSQLVLDWPTRFKICIGIARGLAFLHEESRLKIVHSDIKATNVLLDKDLNPKISDFGLARQNEDEKTHVRTRVAGTIGYMAPEYALQGYLTDKVDVYSYGVVALEIVSGKHNDDYIPCNNCSCLLDWVCHLQTSKKYEELFDERLGSDINKQEAEMAVKIALLCTNGSPSMRPTMSEVVSMLERRARIPEPVLEESSYTEDLRFKAIREFHQTHSKSTYTGSQTQYSVTSSSDDHLKSTLSKRDHVEEANLISH